MTRVASAVAAPGDGTSTAYCRKSGSRRSCSKTPPLACGLALMRRVPAGGSAASSGVRRPCSSKSSVRLVALHPALEDAHVLGLLHVAHRHLVGAPVALDALAVDLLRAGPAFRACAARSSASVGRMRDPCARASSWIWRISSKTRLERRRHQFVHRRGLVPLDEIRFVAVAAQELVELLGRDARKYGRIGDLVAVEVQDRQHGAVAAPD